MERKERSLDEATIRNDRNKDAIDSMESKIQDKVDELTKTRNDTLKSSIDRTFGLSKAISKRDRLTRTLDNNMDRRENTLKKVRELRNEVDKFRDIIDPIIDRRKEMEIKKEPSVKKKVTKIQKRVKEHHTTKDDEIVGMEIPQDTFDDKLKHATPTMKGDDLPSKDVIELRKEYHDELDRLKSKYERLLEGESDSNIIRDIKKSYEWDRKRKY